MVTCTKAKFKSWRSSTADVNFCSCKQVELCAIASVKMLVFSWFFFCKNISTKKSCESIFELYYATERSVLPPKKSGNQKRNVKCDPMNDFKQRFFLNCHKTTGFTLNRNPHKYAQFENESIHEILSLTKPHHQYHPPNNKIPKQCPPGGGTILANK